MDLETIRLFARYNRETNRSMNEILGTMTDDQWNIHFNGYYPSIRALCNHIFIADYAWIRRFGNVKEFQVLKSSFFKEDLTHESTAFITMSEYLSKRESLDQKYLDLIDETGSEDLQKSFTYKTFKGVEQKKNFGGVLLHVFNHQTHHRGMISLYLDTLKIENDFSNLLLML